MSNKCQYETRLIRKRVADQNVKVIPVYYEDFDKAYDENKDGHNYQFQWNDYQSGFRKKGDENIWMNTILNLLPKEEYDPYAIVSVETEAAMPMEDTVNDAYERDGQRKISEKAMPKWLASFSAQGQQLDCNSRTLFCLGSNWFGNNLAAHSQFPKSNNHQWLFSKT